LGLLWQQPTLVVVTALSGTLCPSPLEVATVQPSPGAQGAPRGRVREAG